MHRSIVRAILCLFVCAPPLAAQDARPRPYPVLESQAFARAVQQGTRTRTGRPGPAYWTTYTHYRISAELDPISRTLTGTGTITYQNRSPHTTGGVVLELRQNLFRAGAIRNRVVPITGGMRIARVVAGDRELTEGARPGWEVANTKMYVTLPTPLRSGASVDIEVDWSYVVSPDGGPRGGTDGEVFFLSYWYPQIAVFDDLSGWFTDPYMGNGEFHMGFADYDVELTVPAGWLIGATGTLANPQEVLSTQTRQRLEEARRTRAVVHVVTQDDRPVPGTVASRATATPDDGTLTWRFTARNVRDFAWGTSDQYLWDATSALAGDHDGDGRPDTTLVHTFYRPERTIWAWDRSAEFVQHSVEFLSEFLWPYPWPHMTAVDGVVSCSGMEYPMMTCVGGQRDTTSLYSVIVHETAHMWFPMQVASDEKRHAWLDEGLTRFNQNQAMRDFFDIDRDSAVRENYLDLARADGEVELMRHADRYPVGTPAFGVASYDKMATLLVTLRGLLGEETFMRAYREYAHRWMYRHPTPYDLFNTFEETAGRDLDWFWTPWFYETWTLDQAIASVTEQGDRTAITIRDEGLAPMPVRLAITREGGTIEHIEVPVDVWLNGARTHTITVPASPRITGVEIDPDAVFPDIDRADNSWRR